MEETKDKLKILISGAGIAGLSLAQGIDQFLSDKISYTIIEKDGSFEQRKQGYSLTIQQNGQQVLNFLGLKQKIEQNQNAIKGRGNISYNEEGNIIRNSVSQNLIQTQPFYFMPRQELRQILYQDRKVLWDTTISKYSIEENSKIKVEFSTGHIENFDLIMGCEGVFSKLRTDIFEDKVEYLGVVMINGIIENQENAIPNIHSYTINDQGVNRLFFKPYKPGYMMWQLTHSIELDQAIIISQKEPKYWLELVVKQIAEWNHPIVQLIKNTSLEMLRCGPLYYKNPPFEKLDKLKNRQVLLLGDTIHPMQLIFKMLFYNDPFQKYRPPFKGQGANQAFEDIKELIELFQQIPQNQLKDQSYLQQKLFEYQCHILKRAEKVQSESVQRVKESHYDCQQNKK